MTFANHEQLTSLPLCLKFLSFSLMTNPSCLCYCRQGFSAHNSSFSLSIPVCCRTGRKDLFWIENINSGISVIVKFFLLPPVCVQRTGRLVILNSFNCFSRLDVYTKKNSGNSRIYQF